MRYYLLGFLFAAISTFFFHHHMNERTPASYPNFSGSAATTPTAPTPRELRAPENSSNPFSMKDIEDTYRGFLENETALTEQANASRTRLQHYLNLRSNNPSYSYHINVSSQLLQAIRNEQNTLQLIEMQRQNNSSYAFQKINLLYLSIQIGLRQESHARVNELTSYILSVNYASMSGAYPLMATTTTTSYTDNMLLEFTPMPSPGTAAAARTTETDLSTEDFIGPRLPEQQNNFESGNGTSAGAPGTIAI